MELWDVYDVDRRKTGRLHPRSQSLPQGDYHLVVHVCLFRSDGRLLIQQRQPFKEGWPNLWDVTVGGSALAGETPQQAASRELAEEVGVSVDFTDKRPRLTIPFEKGFDDWFFAEADVDARSLRLQAEEVQAVCWATEAEVLEMLADGRFIPYEPALIQLLFAMRTHSGGLRG